MRLSERSGVPEVIHVLLLWSSFGKRQSNLFESKQREDLWCSGRCKRFIVIKGLHYLISLSLITTTTTTD